MFRNRIPDEDAQIAQRLKASGAIVIGKLNLHEFALGLRVTSRILGRAVIHGRSIVSPGDRPPARVPRLQPICALRRWAPTLEAASGYLLRGAESWALNRPPDWSPFAASSPALRRSITADPWRESRRCRHDAERDDRL